MPNEDEGTTTDRNDTEESDEEEMRQEEGEEGNDQENATWRPEFYFAGRCL